jgi:carboxypeptidase Taq
MATEQSSTERSAYDTILDHSEQIIDLEKVDQLMRWDSDVEMPPGGTPARNSQRTTVSRRREALMGSDDLGRALNRVDEDSLAPGEAANVREIRRWYDITSSVPEDLRDELATTTAEAHEAWKEAKEADDFDRFAPLLEKHIKLRRQWAEHVDPDADPYEVLWKNKLGYESQPYIDMDTVEEVFADLRETLVPLIDDIQSSDADVTTDAFAGTYDPATQRALNEALLDTVGVDWDRANFGVATHPFSYGTQYDVRLTTRFNEDNPFDAMASTLHEFGHTLYSHGLEKEHYGTPLGESRGLTIHGSQSGFWENHVGHSYEFWELFLPKMKAQFPQLDGVTVDEAYQTVNQVYENNLRRTDADEVTYHMHVILRTEIERDLVRGDLDVAEVPQVWNDKMDAYLGVRPDSDADGCLQDPHWTKNVPGFINYTLGHGVLATQVWNAAGRDLALHELIREGRFEPIHEWLREHIHRHGQRYKSQELIRRATGEELTSEYFLEYITDKYERLYDL